MHLFSGRTGRQIAQLIREKPHSGHFINVTETHRGRTDLASYSQLVQELINGSVRRHMFTQSELELLFDLQTSRIRKSSRPDVLRRYLRAVHQQANAGEPLLRLSSFLERESAGKSAPVVSPASTVVRQVAALPFAG